MPIDPLTALHAASRPAPSASAAARSLLVIGAAGPLGSAVLEQALSSGRHASVHVATTGPLQTALRGLVPLNLAAPVHPPVPPVAAAVVVFDRARGRNGREEAFFDTEPGQLPELARWLREGGVDTLAVVLPHAPAMLPDALRHGLATLAEQEVAMLGFRRLLFVRPTQFSHAAEGAQSRLQRFAAWWLSQLQLMLPNRERPVRAATVAELVFEVLRQWPATEPGTRVASAEVVCDAARADGPAAAAARWLAPAPADATV
jgi:hypothetical protein